MSKTYSNSVWSANVNSFLNSDGIIFLWCCLIVFCLFVFKLLYIIRQTYFEWEVCLKLYMDDHAICNYPPSNFIDRIYRDSKVHGANMGPTWVLSAPDGSHVGPMILAIRVWTFDIQDIDFWTLWGYVPEGQQYSTGLWYRNRYGNSYETHACSLN